MKISIRATFLLIASLGLFSTTMAISNCCEVDANRLGCDDQACQDLICRSGSLSEDCCTVGWTASCVYPPQDSSGGSAQLIIRNAIQSCSVCSGVKAPKITKGLRNKSGGN